MRLETHALLSHWWVRVSSQHGETVTGQRDNSVIPCPASGSGVFEGYGKTLL